MWSVPHWCFDSWNNHLLLKPTNQKKNPNPEQLCATVLISDSCPFPTKAVREHCTGLWSFELCQCKQESCRWSFKAFPVSPCWASVVVCGQLLWSLPTCPCSKTAVRLSAVVKLVGLRQRLNIAYQNYLCAVNFLMEALSFGWACIHLQRCGSVSQSSISCIYSELYGQRLLVLDTSFVLTGCHLGFISLCSSQEESTLMAWLAWVLLPSKCIYYHVEDSHE